MGIGKKWFYTTILLQVLLIVIAHTTHNAILTWVVAGICITTALMAWSDAKLIKFINTAQYCDGEDEREGAR